ncbi:BppU family phage baseplate upper protein [Listeria floridensis]|uniref:BppU family phage baseplate upper protein n=1 Tax=Listeria floridensis TaxID=1494962 RepID=UPI0019D3571C|nr:BppU family phage baseplate upper protein [Listeria floridensis]
MGTVGDKDSLTLEVTLTVNSVPFDLTGWSVYFKALLPDDEHFVLDDSTIIDSDPTTGKFSYTFVQEAFSFPGTVYNAKFMLTKGSTPDQITHSFDFNYQVKADPIQGKLEASSFVSDYERFKEEIKEMMQDSLTNSAKALEDSQNAVELSAKAETELAKLRDEIAKSGYVSKTGDSMTGTLNLDGQNALTIRYGSIKHYVGTGLANDTQITFSIGHQSTGHLPEDTLTYVIGGGAVGDSRFSITGYANGYLLGYAPADYVWGRSVVSGGNPVTAKTITPSTSLAIQRDGQLTKFVGNVQIDGAFQFDVSNTSAAPIFDASKVSDTQSWARGFGIRAGNRLAEFGISGKGKVANVLYFGFGASPWVKANSLYIEWETKKAFLFGNELATKEQALSDAKNYLDQSLTVQTVTLTPKNGFVASRALTARYVKMNNRYLVMLGGIVGKGTGTGTGICATVPTILQPDTDWNKLYSAAQQSTSASNQANIYLGGSGDINIVAVGAVDVNTGLDGISYFTKEVTS